MTVEESYIVKQRNLDQIIREQNQGAIEELLKNPLAAIAGAVNDLLLHPTTLASTAVRVAHAALKGRLFQQFATEIKDLQAKGQLPVDFAENKYGYNTWVELLKVIDDDCPDEDRLEALKAMFYAANKMSTTDGERIVAYELFQIARTLSGNELLVLRTLWELEKEGRAGFNAERFYEAAQGRLGHSQVDLIILGYKHLPDKRLAESYVLTRLGKAFCENIQTYRIDTDTQKNPYP